MKYSAGQEKALIEDLLSYSHDPLGFAKYNWAWGTKGSPLEQFGLRSWQYQTLGAIGEHIRAQQGVLNLGFLDELRVYQELISSGRGTGKSALFGILTNWMLSTHLGSSVVVTANTETQMRTKTFPEFGRWFTMGLNAHWWSVESLAIRPATWLANMVKDQLSIDTQYWAATGQNWNAENPDSFAGAHNMYGLAVFYDEASGIPEPIWTVTRGFFTEQTPFRIWMGFSQGRRNNGAFFDRFHDDAHKAFWRTRHLDARTVEGTDKQVYEEIIKVHGADSDEARVEVYGLFPEQGEGQLNPSDVVRDARDREINAAEDNDEPILMGVDPAPRGRTVIRLRQGRDAASFPVTVLNGKNNKEIADSVIDLANRWNPDAICVDAGNGTGVIDDLRDRNVKCHEVWFGKANPDEDGEFALVSGMLWGRMRDWLLTGCIDDSRELYNDLTKRTWEWFGGREDNKKQLNSKRQMAKEGIPSPDDADALALTFWLKLPRRSKRTYRGRRGPGSVAQGTGECDIG